MVWKKLEWVLFGFICLVKEKTVLMFHYLFVRSLDPKESTRVILVSSLSTLVSWRRVSRRSSRPGEGLKCESGNGYRPEELEV